MGEYLAHLDALWLGALIALPVTIGVMAACRLGVRSPATRHALWLIALLAFVAPAIVATTSLPSALREWGAGIADLLPERPIPTDVPAAEATPDQQVSSAKPLNKMRPSLWATDSRPSFVADAPSAVLPIATPSRHSSPSQNSTCGSAETRIANQPSESEPLAAEPHAPTLREQLSEQMAPWIAGLREAVRSLRDVPPLPPLIWLGGITAFLTLLLVRLVIDRRVTRLALPATEPERAALHMAAMTIGLRRPPELVFVPNRVSPMVTCGWRKRLVMPRSLWRVLDSDARQAVLLHEMAHLRRKDHWVHWISLAVGALYWWNPLVWVIRARLRDEADLCCDAWVTALRPERRRGYAETLLRTTAFLNVPGVQTHAAGLAMASPTKRKLARRITMVMTHTVRPKLSVHGSSVVAGAALLALLVMPGVACPPAEKKAPKAHHPEVHVEVHADAPENSTFERHMHDREAEHARQAVRERDAHARHKELARLEAEAAAVRDRLTRIGRRAPEAPMGVTGAARLPSPPDAPMVASTGVKLARAYHMPKGRLHALSTLMVRSDVPVLVSPEHERLVVHATRAQHQTFASFAKMICPEGVMITDEHGKPVADAMIQGQRGAVSVRAPEAARQLAVARELERRVAGERSRGRIAADRAVMADQKLAVEAEYRALMRKSEGVLKDAERVYREAEKVHEESERMREKADVKREKADKYHEKGDYEKAARYEAEAEALEAKAEDLHRASEDLERKAEDIERQAEDVERRAEDLEAHAEELEARAEEIEDHLEELEDELESAREHEEECEEEEGEDCEPGDGL